MLFERFKQIFLTYGICEVEFSLRENNSKLIRIENHSYDDKRLIIVNDKKMYFINCIDLFNMHLIDNFTLEQIWDNIQIDIIDGMIEEDYEQWYSSIEHLVLDYFYNYQVKRSITKEELINFICKDEYDGKLILLAGTRELNSLDINNFKIIIYVPEIYRFYTLESNNNNIIINVLISFIEEIKNKVRKDKNYTSGRLLTAYNDKQAKNKSQKYNDLLKYVKSQNSLFLGGVLLSIEIVLFSFLLYSIPNIKSQPYQFVVSIICFILSWVLIVAIGKRKRRKEKTFEDKYFKNVIPDKLNQGEINPIILEKYETKFESLISRVKSNISNIKVHGLVLEDNSIDLQLEKNPKGLYFNFDPKVLIVFDEEDNTHYYRYDRYTYEELEDILVELVTNYFLS